MLAALRQAGEVVDVDCRLAWVDELLREAAGAHLQRRPVGDGTVSLTIEDGSAPFTDERWEPVGRDAWTRAGEVVLENACTSGFDMHFRQDGDLLLGRARWRPPARDRLAARALPGRFHLLARSVLLQYPAMAWAARRGRAPLHAAACQAGDALPLLAGPGGVGKSTLVLAEMAQGGVATCDNLCVSDGTAVHGVVEPARVEGGTGRRMPHGRREEQVAWSTSPLAPDCLVVLRRSGAEVPSVRPTSGDSASRVLQVGTYSAGELRRYWGFAATVALAIADVPPHPPVREVADTFADRLPTIEIVIGRHPPVRLPQLLGMAGELL